jgi:hypothetical protein
MLKEALGLSLRELYGVMVDPQAEQNPQEVDGR